MTVWIVLPTCDFFCTAHDVQNVSPCVCRNLELVRFVQLVILSNLTLGNLECLDCGKCALKWYAKLEKWEINFLSDLLSKFVTFTLKVFNTNIPTVHFGILSSTENEYYHSYLAVLLLYYNGYLVNIFHHSFSSICSMPLSKSHGSLQYKHTWTFYMFYWIKTECACTIRVYYWLAYKLVMHNMHWTHVL